MDIFLLDLNKIDNTELEASDKNDVRAAAYKIPPKKKQYLGGRFLLNFAAHNFYDINDTTLDYKNKKPFFKNSDMQFSISHSKNIVVVGFSKNPIGVDIEDNTKIRDFVALMEKLNPQLSENIKNIPIEKQQILFYEFWTAYEAKIKLGFADKKNHLITFIPKDGFTLSVATLDNEKISKIIKWEK